jgi:predicted nucleotide-binding protein (sugar kinase/HSP70/actin superfamily)
MPEFGYGCAVFMQSDIVDFQRRGWSAGEIMAGLAAVLPKNIWLYVAQVPNLPALGTRFVLQGGTQHNLAAVKAQVDFIESRFSGSDRSPEVVVHRHCGEAGAIGCALEAHRVGTEERRATTFIGFDRVRRIAYRTTRDENTRCYFCKNNCLRTFIDVKAGVPDHRGDSPRIASAAPKSKVPLFDGERRLIVATCEKGTVEELTEMRGIKQELDAVRKVNPNLVHAAAHGAFADVDIAAGDAAEPAWRWTLGRTASRSRQATLDRRARLRIGMPRVLNMYSHAPFFIGYFKSLGVPYANLVFSNYTDEALYKRGAKRGSIDPCFPSKLAIPHIHDLLYVQHARKPLTHIFFPMVDSFPTPLAHVQGSRACPTVVASAEAAHAAFVKEGDLFQARGIEFKKTFLNLDQPALCGRQMFHDWKRTLDLSLAESERAVQAGLDALSHFERSLRSRARVVLDQLEREGRLGIVVLGRPYHNDPGVNHEITDELQKLGYPLFSQDTLPLDDDLLDRLFGDEVSTGALASPRSIEDVWKNSYSENTNRKVWAAKFAARHPNLAVLELSSFKCGHDAPIYAVVEQIVERSGTPYFCFKDIDENKPAGALRIRLETIAYFLERYRARMVAEQATRREVDAQTAAFEVRLRASMIAATSVEDARLPCQE